jgi:hypothetical protein
VPSDASIEVAIGDDVAVCTGDLVLTLDHAWRLVREFARTGEVGDLGDWYGLRSWRPRVRRWLIDRRGRFI